MSTSNEEIYKALLEAEQECLWDDLNNDLRMAANGYWSIAAESRVGRIIRIGKAVGFTDWEKIQLPLLVNDIYGAVISRAGCEVPKVDVRDHDLPYYVPYWYKTIEEIGHMSLEE